MRVFPPFRLDGAEGRLWKGDQPVVLRRKPFEILCYLAEHPGQLVTHAQLLAEVWRGVVVSDSAMRSHLHELRQVLGPGVIETVVGRGYRFVAALREDAASPGRSAPVAAAPSLVVGREAELESLRGALQRALEGRRQLCFVTGEPGIGKSTLVGTFLAGLDPARVAVARGACFEQHGTPEPYLALIEALGALAASGRGAQTRAALVRHAPTFVAQVPHLVDDAQLAEAARRAAGGTESRQLRELCQALEAIAAQEPLVLVIEDLQWSDIATIDLLSLLGQRPERASLLVLATSRHAEAHSPEHPLNRVMRSLAARSGALVLAVPTIDVAAVQCFLDRRLPGHALPERFAELVARITGGTPLFVVSLVSELVGRGMLAERDGRWTLTVSLDDVRAHRPASVQQLIDLQLDRLPASEQQVLEAASLVGAEFEPPLVAAALEREVEAVDDTCDALARRALFLRAEPGPRYVFTHALVQEVCAERSSPARRQRWHRRIAETLAREPGTGPVAHLLAKHFDAAGEPARAVEAYAEASHLAAQRHATSDSVASCARALDLLPRLPPGVARDRLELRLLRTMCQQVSSNSFSAAFAGRDPLAVHARALQLARGLGEPAALYETLTLACQYDMIVARYTDAGPALGELERLEAAHALDPALLHAGVFTRGYIAYFTADFASAIAQFERLVPAEGTPSVFHANLGGRVLALGHLACARWVVGESDRALAEASETIALADRVQVPILQALGHVVRARLRFLRRDPRPVVEADAQEAVRVAVVDLGLHAEARAFALWAEVLRGPLPLEAIEPMLEVLRRRLTEVSTSSTLVALALIEVLARSGHAEQARAVTCELIDFARAHHERVYLPELLRLRGEQREATEPALAARDYREALELAQATGARSFERRAAESLARLGSRKARR